ncbi:MAG: glycosyltransferase [Solirubrobacterales bacterium]
MRELEQTVSTLIVGLRETKADIERAEQSRAWRLGHGVTRAARRLAMRQIRTKGALVAAARRLERLEEQAQLVPPAPTPGALPPTDRSALPIPEIDDETRAARRAELAAEVRARLGPAPAIETPPKVSIIVLTRDGVQHLRRLVAGLVQSTDYPSFELVVVDNASSDGTHEFLDELEVPFPVVVCRNERNESFSDGNNQGVEAATGELLLFANNDVAPFEPGWLREMVGLLRSHPGGAVGATLLRLEEAWGDGPTTQHRGVRFRSQDGRVRAFNDGDGELLFTECFGRDERAPAMTAACLLVSAETFDRVGGFSDGYRYGTEDVDLGLKLLATGREVWCSGRAILFHEESVTQNAQGRDFQRLNRLGNRKLLLERWGPQLRREHRLALLRGDEEWTGGHQPHIAVTVTSNDDINDGWGDWYTAHEMGDALEDDGWRVTYIERKGDRWYSLPGDVDFDPLADGPVRPAQVPSHVVTIAWIRNWTDRWLERPWFDRIDVLLTSSQGSAELVEQRTGRPSIRFPLATNPDRFAPMPSRPEYEADYVFTGNYWGQPRDVQRAAAARSGCGSSGATGIRSPSWPPTPTAPSPTTSSAVYSSAKLVIDDTAGPTLPYGAVNCRVFDALACGRLPITNCAGRRARALRRGLPRIGRARAPCARSSTPCSPTTSAAARWPSATARSCSTATRTPPGAPLREILLDAEQEAVVRHQDRRAVLGRRRALGRPALRPRDRAGAAPPRPSLSQSRCSTSGKSSTVWSTTSSCTCAA